MCDLLLVAVFVNVVGARDTDVKNEQRLHTQATATANLQQYQIHAKQAI